jgi:S-(hydroxymethyl)glutathione dehydrogenase/alcohol dehydrogenase
MSRAALFVGTGEPLEIHDVDVAEPRTGEVRLKMTAAGICHSDLSVQNGTMPTPPPVILGHEGAGVIEAVGPDVGDLAVGDHVVISWMPQCGSCFFCEREQGHLCEVGAAAARTGSLLDGTHPASFRGKPIPQHTTVGAFAEAAVLSTAGVVKIDPAVDLRVAAVIGCAVLTGVGAAVNTANVRSGDVVVVVGCGGVGLNVVQGALLAGAERVIAVDRGASKLSVAEAFGATDTIDATTGDAVAQVLELTGGRGADVAFEVIGLKQTAEEALAMTRNGGETVLVGVASADVILEIASFRGLVRYGKTLKGCFYGSANVRADVPMLVDAYLAGKLKLDELVSHQIRLDEINNALRALESGEVTRSVIVF